MFGVVAYIYIWTTAVFCCSHSLDIGRQQHSVVVLTLTHRYNAVRVTGQAPTKSGVED